MILNTLNIPPGQSLMCVRIHQIVARMCGQYLAELSRYNYVTPKSYLDLLSIFSSLIGWKKQELHGARLRMKTGLDKVKKKKKIETLSLYFVIHLLCIPLIYENGFRLFSVTLVSLSEKE